MLLALFMLFLFSRVNSGPQIDCFIDLQECDIREDNLISTFLGIPSTEECQQLCEDELTCTAFTHFGSNSHPIPDSCLLFSACKERRACQSCTTGSSQTECTCSISYAGDVTPDNFVGLVPSVQDELACKELCVFDNRCHIYVFYDSEDLLQPQTCFLLTSSGLENAAQPCQNCFSGPTECRVNQTCQATVITNGTEQLNSTNVIFAEKSMAVTLVANEKECFVDLDVVAIGGGGSINFYGGAGSGFVETGRVRLPINTPVMQITVGSSGSPSRVEVGGEVVLEAAPGETPDTDRGGDGYSGGGGFGGAARGGRDGGDGEDGSGGEGGRGSSLDVGALGSEKLSLVPGNGGEGSSSYGGGGGGVVVNGKKPGDNKNAGEGYGGGGTQESNGFQGCVLIEMN